MMGSDDLFYGNLNLRQKEIMNDLMPKYSDVVDHFTAYEFIYPNKNTTYKEVVELNNRTQLSPSMITASFSCLMRTHADQA